LITVLVNVEEFLPQISTLSVCAMVMMKIIVDSNLFWGGTVETWRLRLGDHFSRATLGLLSQRFLDYYVDFLIEIFLVATGDNKMLQEWCIGFFSLNKACDLT
jgi:hypothetical protein